MSWILTALGAFDRGFLPFYLIALGTGIAAAWVDMRDYRVPDAFIAIGSFCAILLGILLEPGALLTRFICSGSGFLLLYLFSLALKQGLGLGDTKFLSLAGFCIGPIGLWICLSAACLSAILFYCLRLFVLRKRVKGAEKNPRPIPFLPFLTGGILISLFAKFLGMC
jgi:Flp pilus assembly protein protease CpaA